MVISGPAGIGKTALLAEICEHATRMTIRVGRSKCDPVQQVWPGAPVIAALRAGRDPLATAGEYEQIAGLPVVWVLASRDDPVGTDPAADGTVRREYLPLALLAEAAGVLDRSPRPVLRAAGAESYGRALLAAGRRPEALAALDRAWDEYHHMGARALRSGVQRTMREAGARRTKWSAPSTAPAGGWARLTDAERRVATLISEGHTNKSAASALGVSVNTVGTHLRSVFAKLGVQSRVQLANRLAGHASQAAR